MKPFLFLFFSFCFSDSFAQDKNQFYALDANMNQTVLDSSKYILWIHEKEDSNWQWDYYYTWGPLIKSNSFADHDGTILNGRFCIYNTFGNLDSTGIYDHGRKNGPFIKLKSVTKDSILFSTQYEYVNDSLVKLTNLLVDSNKKKDEDTTRSKESEYPGAMSNWISYLIHNLRYPNRAINKDIQGRVSVCFLVNEEGYIADPFIEKSVEYSLDQESIRLIRNSGKWIPGLKDGISITTYKIQPILFKIENN